MIYNLPWDKVKGWKILSRGTVKTPEKGAVECVWSLTTTVCSVPVLPGERVYAQSFPVPALSWRLFGAFCSRGEAGKLLGSWMGRCLRKTVGSWYCITPSGSKLPLLTWALVLGMEGDHGCLSRLQPLGHWALDAGSEGLQPLLLGLLKTQVCRGLSQARSLLASLRLALCLLLGLPRLSFFLGRLSETSIPDASRGLPKEPWVGFLRTRVCWKTTWIDWRFVVLSEIPAPRWRFSIQLRGRRLRDTIHSKAGFTTAPRVWASTVSHGTLDLGYLRITSTNLWGRPPSFLKPREFTLPLAWWWDL